MIRSAAVAAALVAFVAAHAPPALAQDATQESGAQRKRPARGARKPEAAKEAPAAAEGAPAAPAEGTRAGRRTAGRKPEKGADTKAPPGLQASPVGTFGDWSVFAAGEGKTRICYAISQPQKRLPASLKRDPAYLFVTVRKAEKVPNEVALMMGFAPKAPASQTASAGSAPPPAPTSAEPTLAIGAAKYTLVIKETNAWLQNPADETRVVGEMARAKTVVVKAVSLRGNPSTDEYALTGFGDAIKRAREECK